MMRGATLLELLIVAAISLLLFGAVFTVLNVGQAVINTDSGLTDLEVEARRGMDVMMRELRQSSASNIYIASGGTGITFKVPTNISADPVVYSLNISYYLSGGQLVREHPPGTAEIIGNNITALSFCCWNGSACESSCSGSRLLEARLNATKTVRSRPLSYRLEEKLNLRNLD